MTRPRTLREQRELRDRPPVVQAPAPAPTDRAPTPARTSAPASARPADPDPVVDEAPAPTPRSELATESESRDRDDDDWGDVLERADEHRKIDEPTEGSPPPDRPKRRKKK